MTTGYEANVRFQTSLYSSIISGFGSNIRIPPQCSESQNSGIGRQETVDLINGWQVRVSKIGFQFYPGTAVDGSQAKGDAIIGVGNGKYDPRWLWDRE